MAREDAHFYRTADGTGLPHDPFNAIIGPRPIGWISTRAVDGTLNLAPYSFFNGFNYRPPVIGFASVGWKDSVANIEATGDFVWNLATRELAEPMNETSAAIPASDDEFVRSGLTPVLADSVGSPRVQESPVNFECRLTQLIQLTDVEGRAAATTPILRAGGLGNYAAVSADAMFTMIRPDDR